jgi:xylulokinase
MMLGIDVGTQSLKAVVLSPDLEVLGEGASGYRPSYPQPGWAEQDPSIWERALGPAISAALDAAHLAPDRIASIGVAGQLDGCVAVDASGAPLHPCLIWMDRRAEAELAGIDGDTILRTCGVVMDAGHPAAKIRWLKRRVAAHLFHVPVSYIVSRLAGADVIDHGTASTSMLYSLAGGGYDDALLRSFGIEAGELPSPRPADSLAGELGAAGAALAGLPAGIPVAVGTGDDFSSALGAGLVEPGRLLNVLGTAEVVGALARRPIIDPQRLVETHAYIGGDFFIENPGWLSGGAIAWFCDTFGVADAAEMDRLAETVPPGAGGVTFIPALSGAMAPEWIASARASFSGVAASHGRAHLARAVLEGTAFAMRDVLDRIVSMGVPISALRIAGGGAKSRLWTRMRADIAGLPAEIPANIDTSAIGAALLGGAAAGTIGDLKSAAGTLTRGMRTLEPDTRNEAAYRAAHGRYLDAFRSMRPLYV